MGVEPGPLTAAVVPPVPRRQRCSSAGPPAEDLGRESSGDRAPELQQSVGATAQRRASEDGDRHTRDLTAAVVPPVPRRKIWGEKAPAAERRSYSRASELQHSAAPAATLRTEDGGGHTREVGSGIWGQRMGSPLFADALMYRSSPTAQSARIPAAVFATPDTAADRYRAERGGRGAAFEPVPVPDL